MKKIGYKHTVAASFTAFVVQAVVNNFAPLLFLTFQAQYGIELSKITVLITANFFIQIFVDLTAVLFVDRIGYRASTVLAHAMCATGLIFMTILPEILPSAFAGLLISVFCYAVGAGLLDITINPIVNSCPSTNSNQLLCLLHSFYCWGSVAAVGISTLFFALFSTDNWKIMSLVWAILPIVNAVMFARVPIAPVVGEDEEKLSIKDMLKTKAFWIFMVLILCAGSSEQAVSISTGMCEVETSSLRWRQNSKPSITGIITSHTTCWGTFFFATASPSSPFCASITLYCRESIDLRYDLMLALSSIINTRGRLLS